MKNKVSIVCAWFNRSDFLVDTINSLLSQEFTGFEIIIVNDGSTDHKVKEILDSYQDDRLVVIHQENQGFVAAIRRAIEQSTTPFIAVQGAGDISKPYRIQKQYDLISSDKSLVAVGSQLVNEVVEHDGHRRILTRTTSNLAPRLSDFLNGDNPFSHGEVMFRRDVYEQVGGYRPFFRFAQDRDLWIRLGEKGTFSIVDEELYVRRVFHNDGVSADINKIILQQTLSSFARQCYFDRRSNVLSDGRDYVDVYGGHAGLFRRSSKRLSVIVARQAVKVILWGDLLDGKRLAKFAWAEHKNFYSVAAFLLSVIQGDKYIPGFIGRFLAKKIKGFVPKS